LNYTDKMDPECVALCDAMNRFEGIRTNESCCGHGKDNFRIWFSAESLDVLPPLLYYFASCHSGVYGWSVRVKTDCGMSPAHFCAESEEMGNGTYLDAEKIAECMNDYLDNPDEEAAI